jgi:hypothetical protein
VPDPPRIPTSDELAHLAGDRLFGRPIVQNNYRGEVVETIVERALGNAWPHCGADWTGWDFQSGGGLRIQVRQSAAKQTWDSPKTTRPTFSIKPSKGYYTGPVWHAELGRHCEIFVFAWHPLVGDETDHRDASQWRFWVIAERELPSKQKSISLVVLQRKWGHGLAFGELGPAVDAVAARLRS